VNRLSRRKFLSGVAVVSGAVAGAGILRPHKSERGSGNHDRRHYSAIVVGSGYGGGVTALRLGEAGIDTLVIEKGRWWRDVDADGKRFSKMVTPDNRAGWFTSVAPSLVPSHTHSSVADIVDNPPSIRSLQAGICEKVVYGAHSIFRGIAVGGSSMNNAAIVAIPTIKQLREAFPDIDSTQFLGTYIERAKRMLRVEYRDMSWFERTPHLRYARLGREYGSAAGYSVDYNGSAYSFAYLQQEEAGRAPRSALDNEQQFGNNYGRCGTVEQTYIASGLRTGKVTIKPLTEVISIHHDASAEYVVSTREIDRWGNEVSRAEFSCDQLHLNAGVLGTVKLLLRARGNGQLPNLSQEIGRGYGNNGDFMVSHTLKDNYRAGAEQSLMGMISLDGRDDPDNPVYANICRYGKRSGRDTLGYYAMVKTGDRADISYDPRSDSINIPWPEEYTEHIFERGRTVFDKLLIANGVDYRNDVFEGNIMAPNTVHPMGGCVRRKATDRYGRVYGYDNLYVNDASLLPGYLGCNPLLTVAALAEHNIEAILQGRH
jgi:cholesterol oxidase